MKEIKLTGRERSVLRYIDFATGTKGEDLLEHTRLEPDDLVGVLNGLMTVGYVEIAPYAETTDEASFRDKLFEVNPSYALELRAAMARL
jgi:DNA-binding MarR family transcriptional regulator